MISPGDALDRAFSSIDGGSDKGLGKYRVCPVCGSHCSADPGVFKCHNCSASLGKVKIEFK